MKIRVQVVIEGNEDVPPEVHQVADLQHGDLGVDTLGLQLAEAKELLARVREVVVDEQARACLADKVAHLHCRRPRRHKDQRSIAMRTLFGTPILTVSSTAASPSSRRPASACRSRRRRKCEAPRIHHPFNISSSIYLFCKRRSSITIRLEEVLWLKISEQK